MKRIITMGLALLSVNAAFSSHAAAATREVCFGLILADARQHCPLSETPGARRGCNPAGSSAAVGHVYELWDKDGANASADDYIGTWIIGGEGIRCVTFEWEGASYSGTEANPDVYVRYVNTVSGVGEGDVTVTAVKRNGSAWPDISWRNGPSGDTERWVARNCAAGAGCRIYPEGYLLPGGSGTNVGKYVQALDSAQHTLQVYGSIMDTSVNMHFPNDTSKCDGSCTWNRDEIHIENSAWGATSGATVAHEMGHVIQRQQFNRDSLINDCSLNGEGHTLTGAEYESCATTEGWAEYVGTVSWYDPDNAATVPYYRNEEMETPETEHPSCSSNGNYELQVAKAFWDFDDTWALNEGAAGGAWWDDVLSYQTLSIASGWLYFANGTDNREEFEGNRSDPDGVNMRDFYYNNEFRFGDSGIFAQSFLGHNCLQYQDYY